MLRSACALAERRHVTHTDRYLFRFFHNLAVEKLGMVFMNNFFMKVIRFCLRKTTRGSFLKQNNSDLVSQTRTRKFVAGQVTKM